MLHRSLSSLSERLRADARAEVRAAAGGGQDGDAAGEPAAGAVEAPAVKPIVKPAVTPTAPPDATPVETAHANAPVARPAEPRSGAREMSSEPREGGAAPAPDARLPAAAVLIDFENLLFGLSNRFGSQRAAELIGLPQLLSVVRERLWPSVRRAYGDWRVRELGTWQGELYRQGFEVVPVLSKPGGGWRKNASDIRLAVDAVELALTSPQLDTFVIVSGDRDMVEIVRCLQRHGKRVWCIAPEASASSDLTGVCDLFLPYARVHELAQSRDVPVLPQAGASAEPYEAASGGHSRVREASPTGGGAIGNGAPLAPAPSGAAGSAGAQPATESDLAGAQQELLAETDLVRTGFEARAARRRGQLGRWHAFAATREHFTLAEVFDALAEGLAANRSALAKLFTMLYQGRAFELDNYDPQVPFRERALRFSPEIRSADDLVRLHERSAVQRLFQRDAELATPQNARVLLGLAPEELSYAEALLEELRAERDAERPAAAAAAAGAWAGIQAGQRRKGVVKKVADYGAVVALDGIDGLLHVSDISWGRIEHPSQVLEVNQDIEVVVLGVEPARGRVNLGLKQLSPSPWTGIETRYPVGSEHEAEIVALKHYGAFCDLELGITGLVHNTEISWARHVHHPSELLTIGQRVRVHVQEVDKEKRRIALSIRATQANPWEFAELGYPVGSVVEGRVTHLAGYGAFVELERGLQGLLHVSELSWTRQPAHPSELLAVGDAVRCRVLSVDAQHGRMALGLKQLQPDPWEHDLVARLAPGSEHEGQVLRIDKDGVKVLLAGDVEGALDGVPDGTRLAIGDRLLVAVDVVDAAERTVRFEFVHADWPENRERAASAAQRLDALRLELAALLEERHPDPWLGSKLKEELARRHGARFEEGSFGAPSFARLLDQVPDVARVERRDGADIRVHRA